MSLDCSSSMKSPLFSQRLPPSVGFHDTDPANCCRGRRSFQSLGPFFIFISLAALFIPGKGGWIILIVINCIQCSAAAVLRILVYRFKPYRTMKTRLAGFTLGGMTGSVNASAGLLKASSAFRPSANFRSRASPHSGSSPYLPGKIRNVSPTHASAILQSTKELK